MTTPKHTFETTLIVRFTVIGLIVTVTAAAAFGYYLQLQLVAQERAEAAALARQQVARVIEPLLSGTDLSAPLAGTTLATVDAAVRGEALRTPGVVRVKIWNRDAVLVYSDTGEGVGMREADADDLAEALGGEVHAGISELTKSENVAEAGQYDRLLEVYAPIGDGVPVGAYEIYAVTDVLDARVGQIRRNVAIGVFGGFGALYLALFGVVAQASRRLVKQANDNERLAREVVDAYDQTIEGWARTLELRDEETEGHARRVTELTVEVAREMGMPADEIDDVRRGALLHDIGKIGIPDAILLKPGPLDDDEWAVMRMHPEYARHALDGIGYVSRAVEIPYSHHEKWDGSGYPQGLAGEAIPLPARIFAIVDVWDALSNDRPYRKAWPQERVIEHLRSQAGTHFDPDVIGTFLVVLGRYSVSGGVLSTSDARGPTSASA